MSETNNAVEGIVTLPIELRFLKSMCEIALENVYLSTSEDVRKGMDKLMNTISATGIHAIMSVEVIEHLQLSISGTGLMSAILSLHQMLGFYLDAASISRGCNFREMARNSIINFSTLVNSGESMLDENVSLSMSIRSGDAKELLTSNPFITTLYLVQVTGAWVSFFINTRGTPGNPLSIEAND